MKKTETTFAFRKEADAWKQDVPKDKEPIDKPKRVQTSRSTRPLSQKEMFHLENKDISPDVRQYLRQSIEQVKFEK